MNFWLMKSEPNVFSFDHLKDQPRMTSCWDGVRNYQARNFMRDEMKTGDLVLFYHSSCARPAAVGLARVIREGYPDHTAFDPKSRYYDEKSKADAPRWFMVDIRHYKNFEQPVTLKQMKEEPQLEGMLVTKRGQRLSIQPVSREHFARVCELGGVDPEDVLNGS